MKKQEMTREQLLTEIETLHMEIEKLKEIAAKAVEKAAELVIADKELAFQNTEKGKRVAELVIADKELAFQTGEKADRAAELVLANKELAFQSEEKADRAAELVIANKELAFQNAEKDKRAAELQNVQLLLKCSLESPKDMIILSIDQNYNYFYFNKAYKEAMKSAYDKEVTIGMNLLDAITSEMDRINAKINYDLALQGESHSTIQQYETKGISYQETFYNPIINENNQIIGATVFARDVTERMRTEAVLQRQVAAQALLLEISNNFNNVVVEDIDAMLDTTLRMIGEYDHNDRSYIFLFSEDRSTISSTHEWCAEGIFSATDILQDLSVSIFPWLEKNLQVSEYTYIPRVADLPPQNQVEKVILQAASIQSFIGVPMFLEDKACGILGAASVRSEKNLVRGQHHYA